MKKKGSSSIKIFSLLFSNEKMQIAYEERIVYEEFINYLREESEYRLAKYLFVVRF